MLGKSYRSQWFDLTLAPDLETQLQDAIVDMTAPTGRGPGKEQLMLTRSCFSRLVPRLKCCTFLHIPTVQNQLLDQRKKPC